MPDPSATSAVANTRSARPNSPAARTLSSSAHRAGAHESRRAGLGRPLRRCGTVLIGLAGRVFFDVEVTLTMHRPRCWVFEDPAA
jgi:hypothetical protein